MIDILVVSSTNCDVNTAPTDDVPEGRHFFNCIIYAEHLFMDLIVDLKFVFVPFSVSLPTLSF